jgi:polyisoprenoid-binding protein YceI
LRPRLLALILCVVPLGAQEKWLELDPARTEINFTLGDVLHKVHGVFQLKRGTIRFDPVTGKAGGELIVAVASGDSGSAGRDRRMHKEILQSQKYPEAIFTPDRMEGHLAPEGDSQVDIHGQFKLHGAEHEMTIQAQVRMKGDEVTASARFEVPYVKWGMKNPSTFILRVSDQVEVEVRAIGRVRQDVSGLLR